MTAADAHAQFPSEWIGAWNAHDLDAIVDHYAADVVYRSPFVTSVLGIEGGLITGTAALREYFAASLTRYPELRFVLHGAYWGIDSVVLHYGSVNDLVAAELFIFDAAGLVAEVRAHHTPAALVSG
jgi:hypothetical protein